MRSISPLSVPHPYVSRPLHRVCSIPPVRFVFVAPSGFSCLPRVKCQGCGKQQRVCISARRRPCHVAVHFERVIVLGNDQFDTAESAGQSTGTMIYLGEWEFQSCYTTVQRRPQRDVRYQARSVSRCCSDNRRGNEAVLLTV